jgi:hypothetical protein
MVCVCVCVCVYARQTIWRSFYCAIVAAITLRGIDPLHRLYTGALQVI